MPDTIPTLTPFTRDVFINFKPRTRTVELADYGLTATIRELRASESIEFEKLQKQNPEQASLYLVRTALVAEDGTQLVEDSEKLDHLPFPVLQKLVGEVVALSFPQPAVTTKQASSTPAGD